MPRPGKNPFDGKPIVQALPKATPRGTTALEKVLYERVRVLSEQVVTLETLVRDGHRNPSAPPRDGPRAYAHVRRNDKNGSMELDQARLRNFVSLQVFPPPDGLYVLRPGDDPSLDPRNDPAIVFPDYVVEGVQAAWIASLTGVAVTDYAVTTFMLAVTGLDSPGDPIVGGEPVSDAGFWIVVP